MRETAELLNLARGVVSGVPGLSVVERSFSDDDSLCSIGLANIHAKTDAEENKNEIERVLRLFKNHGVNLAVFPEFCLSSYFWEDEDCWEHMDTAVMDRHVDWLRDTIEGMLDDTLRLVVLNNIREGSGRKYFNSTFVVNAEFDYLDPEWIYDKTFLPGIEKTYTESGGADRLVIDTEWGRFGFSTCYDFCFSQIYQEMSMVDEVDAVIQVASWRGPAVRNYPGMNRFANMYYGELWDMLMPSTAARNQISVVAANACGEHEVNGAEFWGGSGLWMPSGMKMVQAGREPELVIVHNVDFKGQRQKEKDDFDYAEDFEMIYDIIDGKRAFTRMGG